MSKNAFPEQVFDNEKLIDCRAGLTKRELFAAMAMQGLSTALPDEDAKILALMSVAQADALIEALSDLIYFRTTATPDPEQ